MDATQVTSQMAPCSGPLPDLEIPMINTIVTCLASEHRKLNDHILQLALAATRLASVPGELIAKQRAAEVWDDIRRELWSHLQIEDELVFSWGEAHHAMSDTLFETLKLEREAMRKLLATLPVSASPAAAANEDRVPETPADRAAFAHTLLALAQNLDSHIQRYDAEVLPSILRELFHR
jgi:iron-sulfur cluster repair protein YtfE (RIC family)